MFLSDNRLCGVIVSAFRRLLVPFLTALLFTVPVSARADYTAVINPNSMLVTNYEGWGVSLCWWANVIASYPNRTNYVDLAFKTLKLNIARYNIGAGQNPTNTATPGEGVRAVMQGFEPSPGVWNWNADTNQRWVLRQARALGVNLVDAFANSPPWWMCINSNCDGNAGGTNNLQADCEMPFANYLTTVVSNLTILDGDHFDYLTPMNEPNGTRWTGTSQEGCDMSPSVQSTVVQDVYASLQTNAPSVGIDAAEDYDPDQTYIDLSGYSSAALNDVSLISTHTYSLAGESSFTSEVSSLKKPFWGTEYGDSDGTGLTMARYIYNDITSMKARAWCYWQVVDSASGWGFLSNSLLDTTNSKYTDSYTINEKFYVMGQFSEYIRPGCKIISVNDTNTLAAWNPTNGTLVLVAINNSATGFNVTYNLSDFSAYPWQVSATQTASGENGVTLSNLLVNNEKFVSAIPAESVTTFVLTTNTYPPQFTDESPSTYPNTIMRYAGDIPTFSVLAGGSVPLDYQWYSNNVPIAGATNTAYVPPVITAGSTVSFACVASNMAGLATNTWSVDVVPAPVASYPHTALALGPVAFWPLNEHQQTSDNDGVIAVDYVGGNDGIYTNVLLGQMTYDSLTDPSDTSARFGYVAATASCVYNIPGPDFSTPNGSNANFTVTAWVNSSGNNGLNTPTIAAKGYYYQEEYALDAGASDCYRFAVRNAAGNSYNANSVLSLSSSGKWYYLAGVCNEAAGTVQLYTNGVLAASVAIPTASGVTNSSETPMTIGSRATSASSGFIQQFPGYIANVAIYNYPLSASQVETLYQAGVSLPPSGLTFTNLSGTAGLNWNYGTLQSATNVAGPYTDMTNATAPYVIPGTKSQQFFRIREN